MSFTPSLGNILIVDDDENIIDLLQINLRSEGYSIAVEKIAENVNFESLDSTRLIIVDAMHQDYSGMDLIYDLKENPRTAYISVILYSDIKSERMVIDALDAGADDYVVKPFSLRELMARIKSILRRQTHMQTTQASTLQFKELTLDQLSQTVKVNGQPLQLTKIEYALLLLLLKNKDTYLSRIELHRNVWTDSTTAGTNERIVDTNISRLRKKLGDLGMYIVSRTGHGYMLTANV